jgi:hypothetical protein
MHTDISGGATGLGVIAAAVLSPPGAVVQSSLLTHSIFPASNAQLIATGMGPLPPGIRELSCRLVFIFHVVMLGRTEPRENGRRRAKALLRVAPAGVQKHILSVQPTRHAYLRRVPRQRRNLRHLILCALPAPPSHRSSRTSAENDEEGRDNGRRSRSHRPQPRCRGELRRGVSVLLQCALAAEAPGGRGELF